MNSHDCKTCQVKGCQECLNCRKQEELLTLLRPATKKQKATALQYLVAQPMGVKAPK